MCNREQAGRLETRRNTGDTVPRFRAAGEMLRDV